MKPDDLALELSRRWLDQAECLFDADGNVAKVTCTAGVLAELCSTLTRELGYSFGGLIVEERSDEWELRYTFYGEHPTGWLHVLVHSPIEEREVPSIASVVHAADWHEREAEDLFGLVFAGHPRLGDFVLHDDVWQEGVEPMRRSFDARAPLRDRSPNTDWRPHRIVHAPGSFVMSVGPVFSGLAESAQFQLETVGEDVLRAFPRLFYKYRGIEKIAEGRPVEAVLLLAERFSATTAFAHGLAFCHAVESMSSSDVPLRARVLRVLIAELERLRHHIGAIAGICESTGLAVAASQAASLEEDLLRASGELTGHRYLFGLAVPGGVAVDLSNAACEDTLRRCQRVLATSDRLWEMLRLTSSFVDRLEEVGFIEESAARHHGLVGPIARASGIARDLRAAQPYDAYRQFAFFPALEREGDGYARLRVLFAEARQAVRLMEQAVAALGPGPVHSSVDWRAGAGLGAVEAPRGAALHWVRLDEDGEVLRYRIVPPSFINWHGFHLAVEEFAFQDLPIILATLDLSVAENDR